MRYPYVSQTQSDFAEFYAAARDDCLRAVLASTGLAGVGGWQLAEDLVAEAFARAWASWRTVSRHPAPRAWVVRTALNLHVSWWRRRRREVPLSEGAAAAVSHPGPELSQVDSAILAVLAGLPDRQRQVVALRIFLDLDTAGTAEALGIAPGTVTAHLARAISALRAGLGAHSRLDSPDSQLERQ